MKFDLVDWSFTGILCAIVLFTSGLLVGTWRLESRISDCEQLGGFRYGDKVFTCQRIRSNPIRPSTNLVPLYPEFAEGSEIAEQPGKREGSGRKVPF